MPCTAYRKINPRRGKESDCCFGAKYWNFKDKLKSKEYKISNAYLKYSVLKQENRTTPQLKKTVKYISRVVEPKNK